MSNKSSCEHFGKILSHTFTRIASTHRTENRWTILGNSFIRNIALRRMRPMFWRNELDLSAINLRRFTQTLSAVELQHPEQFHFERDGHGFTIARGILKTILGSCLDIEPAQPRSGIATQKMANQHYPRNWAHKRFSLTFLTLVVLLLTPSWQITRQVWTSNESATFLTTMPRQTGLWKRLHQPLII